MAKGRFRKFRAKASGFAKRFTRRSKSASKRSGIFGSGQTSLIQLPAMAYGAVRQPVATQAVSLVGGFLPLGEYTDEVVMGVASWLVAKNTSGFVRDMAIAGLVVENARVGETLSKQFLGTGSASSSSVANNQVSGY